MLLRINARLTALAIIVALVAVLFAISPVKAHTPSMSTDCGDGWAYSLLAYNTNGDNSVEVWIDGAKTTDIADFGRNHSDAGTWPNLAATHTIRVKVVAWDDPTGSRGWTFDRTLTSEECPEPTTTTTTVPPTTTTTVPPTTTTTVPPTTTTTEPPTTTTTEPPTTTTTEPPTTTTTEPATTTTTVPETTTTAPATTTTTEPPTTTTVPPEECEEGFVLNDDGECELPITGAGDDLKRIALWGALLSTIGLAVLAGSRSWQERQSPSVG